MKVPPVRTTSPFGEVGLIAGKVEENEEEDKEDEEEEEMEFGGAPGAALLGCGGVARSSFVCVKNGVGDKVLARRNPAPEEEEGDKEPEVSEEAPFVERELPRLEPDRKSSGRSDWPEAGG